MKKLLALLLALIAVMGLFSSLGEEAPFKCYESSFAKGTDGWYPRSTGSAKLEILGNCLKITGRTDSWNSPGRDFALEAGTKYRFSFNVKQNAVEACDMMVSVAHSKNGVESYENLARASAKRGVWTTLSGTYTPGEYDNYILYVETVGNGSIDFLVKDIVVEDTRITYDLTLPSLKELYAPYFDLGCAINQTEVYDRQKMEFIDRQFSIITFGNELKPDFVLDIGKSRRLAQEDETAVAVRFDSAKPMLDYCMKMGIKVHGHVLVWHSQTPDAFFREGYKSNGSYVSREVMLKRMENYIRQVLEYTSVNYPGLIVSWDVVNEAVSDGSATLRESNWTRVVGQDFVNRAFEYARKYAPEGTLLYYNDYNTPMEPKLTGISNLLDSLLEEGNIDGYGFQCHYSSTSPAPSAVRRAMQLISGKGLRLRVSELDVGIPEDTDLQRKIQGYRYSDLFKVFMEFADSLEAVQFWGVLDDGSWRSDEFPLVFDGKGRAKTAFYQVVEIAENAGAQ